MGRTIMKNPGLQIEVSKEEFQKKPNKERDWMLFQAIQQINSHGCKYGRSQWKKIFTLGGICGLVGGFLGGVFKRLI